MVKHRAAVVGYSIPQLAGCLAKLGERQGAAGVFREVVMQHHGRLKAAMPYSANILRQPCAYDTKLFRVHISAVEQRL